MTDAVTTTHLSIIGYTLLYYFCFFCLSLVHIIGTHVGVIGNRSTGTISVWQLFFFLMLFGFPPLPSFFIKVGLIVSIINSGHQALAVSLVIMYVVIWCSLGSIFLRNVQSSESQISVGSSHVSYTILLISMLVMFFVQSLLLSDFFLFACMFI